MLYHLVVSELEGRGEPAKFSCPRLATGAHHKYFSNRIILTLF